MSSPVNSSIFVRFIVAVVSVEVVSVGSYWLVISDIIVVQNKAIVACFRQTCFIDIGNSSACGGDVILYIGQKILYKIVLNILITLMTVFLFYEFKVRVYTLYML